MRNQSQHLSVTQTRTFIVLYIWCISLAIIHFIPMYITLGFSLHSAAILAICITPNFSTL